MTWKDKLEIGLKEDAPYRRDNLPDAEKATRGPLTKPGDPTRSPVEPGARERSESASPVVAPQKKSRGRRTAGTSTGRRARVRGRD
jgi:hypothetical protein